MQFTSLLSETTVDLSILSKEKHRTSHAIGVHTVDLKERHLLLIEGLCIYGQSGHQLLSCPIRLHSAKTRVLVSESIISKTPAHITPMVTLKTENAAFNISTFIYPGSDANLMNSSLVRRL